MSSHRIPRTGARPAGIMALAAGLVLATGSIGWAQAPAGDETPAVVKDFEAGQKPGAKTKGAPGAKTKGAPGAKSKAEPEAKVRKSTVRLSFSTVPRASARVYFGRKLLGKTPFSVDWPRDSGPVDVVVRAHGYLPVNTRAYTFRDDDVSVSLTRPGGASRLLGYKAPVDPEPEEGEEGAEDGEGEDAPTSPAPTSPAPTSPAPTSPAPASPAPASPAPATP